MNAPPLFRPSELARFWELHPKTVYLWIREGRLPAVRTPGDQFRLRSADVRAFSEAQGLPLPPFAREESRRAFVGAAASPAQRVVRRALRQAQLDVAAFDSPLDALLASVADPPALLVLDAAARGVSIDEAVRALRKAPRTHATPLVVFNVSSPVKANALVRAGATRAIVRAKEGARERAITAAIAELFPP